MSDRRKKISSRLGRLLLAGAGGAGVFLAFPTFDLAPLAWVALVPLVLSVRGTGGRGHFFLGWFGGTVTNLGGFWWICGMLMDFGHLGPVPSALLTLLLCAYQGLRFALTLWLGRLLRRATGLGWWLVLPAVYTAVEFLQPFIFPWFYANSQYWVIPAIQVVELGGVTLLSFLLVMVNGALCDAAEKWIAERHWHWRRLLVAASVCTAVFLYGLVRVPMIDAGILEAKKLKIGLVEADVGIWEKEDPQKTDDNLVRHQRLSSELERRGAELILWPETSFVTPLVVVQRRGEAQPQRHRVTPRDAVRFLQSRSPPPEHAEEDRRAGTPIEDRVAPQRGFTTPLLFGVLTARANPENSSPRHPGLDFLNSAALLDADGTVLGMTDKVHLLVFGEYIPFGHRFPVFYKWLPEAGDLTPGEKMEVLGFRGHRLGVMICYEDILPEFTLQVAHLKPQLLINLTNDAWFGKTSEPYLHLALAVFRTVENRVGLIRSTNTGVSAFVDPAGRIMSQTSIHDAETLMESMPLMDSTTPYQKLGNWPAWLSLCIFPWGLWKWRRQSRRSS